MKLTINIDLDIQVDYEVHGRYRPATFFEPAEHAEVEVIGAFISVPVPGKNEVMQVNIIDLLDEETINFIETECLENMESDNDY